MPPRHLLRLLTPVILAATLLPAAFAQSQDSESVAEAARRGVMQYVILGAGLDTFAQRCPQIASRLRVFEVDRPAPQAWKRRRLIGVGADYIVPNYLCGEELFSSLFPV